MGAGTRWLDAAHMVGMRPRHATLFSVMAGAVDESAVPGMGAAVVKTLKAMGMRCSCMAAYVTIGNLHLFNR